MRMIRFAAVAIAAAGVVGSATAEAGFSCVWQEGEPECSSPAGIEDFPIRLRKTRALFEMDGCRVSKIMAWSEGSAPWAGAGYPDGMEVMVSYKCTDAQARPKQQSNARYGFICASRMQTYYESGFDFGADGKPMHWDSQGTSTPIPPAPLAKARNKLVEPLYKTWCE